MRAASPNPFTENPMSRGRSRKTLHGGPRSSVVKEVVRRGTAWVTGKEGIGHDRRLSFRHLLPVQSTVGGLPQARAMSCLLRPGLQEKRVARRYISVCPRIMNNSDCAGSMESSLRTGARHGRVPDSTGLSGHVMEALNTLPKASAVSSTTSNIATLRPSSCSSDVTPLASSPQGTIRSK